MTQDHIPGKGVRILFIDNTDSGDFPARRLLQAMLSFKDNDGRERPPLCAEFWPDPVLPPKDLRILDIIPDNA